MSLPAAIMSMHSLNLCVVLSDTNRVINANRGHYLALSLLFVLPLSFSVIMYPPFSQAMSIIFSYLFWSSYTTLAPEGESPRFDKSNISFTVFHSLVVLLFSIFTTASVAHSTWNGFFGWPLKFTSSLKSILVSFFPLTATYIMMRPIMGLIFFAVGNLTVLIYGGILPSGAEAGYRKVCFLGLLYLYTVLLVGVMIHVQLEWYLAYVIVVIETNSAFTALRRCSDLVKGMRSVAFSIIAWSALLLGIISTFFSSSAPSPINRGSVSWMFVLQAVVFTGLATILIRYSVAANAVLFMHCKALHRELGPEIVYEFGPLYARLPFDGAEKVPKVVDFD